VFRVLGRKECSQRRKGIKGEKEWPHERAEEEARWGEKKIQPYSSDGGGSLREKKTIVTILQGAGKKILFT